jgi:hypothetical protein
MKLLVVDSFTSTSKLQPSPSNLPHCQFVIQTEIDAEEEDEEVDKEDEKKLTVVWKLELHTFWKLAKLNCTMGRNCWTKGNMLGILTT